MDTSGEDGAPIKQNKMNNIDDVQLKFEIDTDYDSGILTHHVKKENDLDEFSQFPLDQGEQQPNDFTLRINTSLFNCDICEDTFETEIELKSHIKGWHGDELSKNRLSSDTKTVIGPQRKSRSTPRLMEGKICPHQGCKAKLSDEVALLNHMSNEHRGGKRFICIYKGCNKRFITRSKLRSHSFTHTNVKPLKCNFGACNKSYKQKKHLNVHMKVHLEGKRYKCDFQGCDRFFSNEHDVAKHVPVHSGKTKFECGFDDCGRTFNKKDKLIRHMKMHSGEKPFKCAEDGCNKTYKHKKDLNIHLQVHLKGE